MQGNFSLGLSQAVNTTQSVKMWDKERYRIVKVEGDKQGAESNFQNFASWWAKHRIGVGLRPNEVPDPRVPLQPSISNFRAY